MILPKIPRKFLFLSITALILTGIGISVLNQKDSREENITTSALALDHPKNPSPYQGQGSGVDVSYPQCKLGLPAPPSAFAIIGVTKGRSFTRNPCLNTEWLWAHRTNVPLSLYLNLNFPSGKFSDRGLSGPKGECQESDLPCQAYNYGWNASADAKSYADSLLVSSKIWWLDIETYNTWEFSGKLNSQTIQAAIDYFTKSGLAVGIYTTPRMWAAITDGNYDPKVPVWIAGAQNKQEAKNFCGISIGSGPVWLSQFGDAGPYDRDLVC